MPRVHFRSELIKSLFFVPFAKSNGLYQANLVRGLDSQLRDVFLHDAVRWQCYIDKRRAALLASAMMLTVMGLCFDV